MHTIIHDAKLAEMGQMAAESALRDAGLDYRQIQAVAASYCYGDPTSGKLKASPLPSILNLLILASVGQKAVYGKSIGNKYSLV